MNIQQQFLGKVRKGELHILVPESHQDRCVRLTGAHVTAGIAPESEEIDLLEYEDEVVMVEGNLEGDWIHSAEIAEEAGPVLSNYLETLFSREMAQKKLCVLVVGHHPDRPGAVNKNHNISEYEFNRKLAPRIERKVQSARVQKVFCKTYEKLPQDISYLNPDFVISLHCNTYDNVATGTEVLYCEQSPESKEIAQLLQRRLVDCLGLKDRGIMGRRPGELGYSVLCRTSAPSVMAEPFFISNDQDLVQAMENLDQLATAYAEAIDEIASMLTERDNR